MDDSLDNLALAYASGDDSVAEKLLRRMEPTVRGRAKICAGHYRGGDREDLWQIGRLAALDAAKRFDPGRGLKFSTFASYRITFALADEMRENQGLIRLPRPGGRVHANYPEDVERANPNSIRSLDFTVTDNQGKPIKVIEVDSGDCVAENVERREVIATVRRLIEALPPRWAEVMRRRLRDETMLSIGRAMGWGESNVSIIHASATATFKLLAERHFRGAPSGPVLETERSMIRNLARHGRDVQTLTSLFGRSRSEITRALSKHRRSRRRRRSAA